MAEFATIEDRTRVYGHGLFLVHLVITLSGWLTSLILGKTLDPFGFSAQFFFALVCALLLLIPIAAVTWGYFRFKTNTA